MIWKDDEKMETLKELHTVSEFSKKLTDYKEYCNLLESIYELDDDINYMSLDILITNTIRLTAILNKIQLQLKAMNKEIREKELLLSQKR